ncbi:hypothetical protein [Bacteroides caecimuris]|uniref:hypothetical protein n=1 Tax=Bacteroides caecimuris TaxID=1796613 RepID=UPI0026E5135F|nr:hypothetical protein [Bacteroides caecimuris]
MGKTKVAMVLYTSGLEYDDRIRKEMLSISKHCPDVEFEVFAVTPKNIEEEGVTGYGVKYHLPYLKSRDKYASKTHVLAKAWDFYKTVKPKLKSFDVIWCADIETFLFPLLLKTKKALIWDLHELPTRFMNSGVMKRVFRYMEKRCNVIYHANGSRIDRLRELGMVTGKTPHIAIRNYPNANLSSTNVKPIAIAEKFYDWLADRKCIYLQGLVASDRRPFETVSAVMDTSDYCGVVVGGFPDEIKTRLIEKYGENNLKNRIFFAGKVPQLQTRNFIEKCRMGIVLYVMDCLNNIYCEPNRMFQTIMMGKPVIVGANPPMKELVEKYNVGKALNDDGGSIDDIRSAIEIIDYNYESLSNNTIVASAEISWESQEELLVNTFKQAINIDRK